MNPFAVPLLNTAVLLSSGVSVTWAHLQLVSNKRTTFLMLTTVGLGAYFTLLQLFEYGDTGFRIRDRVYGARFFVATGFHGLHVLVGTSFLLVCFFRLKLKQLRSAHHLGFEMAI